MAKTLANAVNHMDLPVRLTVAGSIRTGKSETVNSLLRDRHAAKLNLIDTPSKLFYEYHAAVEIQPKNFRIKIVLLEVDEIESDLRDHLILILEPPNDIDYQERELSVKAVTRMLNIDYKAKHKLADVLREKRKTLSFDKLYNELRDKVIANLKGFPSNPDEPSTLVFDMDAAQELSLDAQNTTVWPFIYKIEVYCWNMPIRDLVITDCPGVIANCKRLRCTMDKIIENTEILITCHNCDDVIYNRYPSHYLSRDVARPFYQIALITGEAVEGSSGWEFKPREGSYLLSKDDADLIKKSRDNATIARKAYKLARKECDSLFWNTWVCYGQGVEHLWRTAESIKHDVHVMLRAKQVKLKMLENCVHLKEGQVRRVFNQVYHNFLRKEEKVGDGSWNDSESESDGDDPEGRIGRRTSYEFWTEEKSGVPALRADIARKIKCVLQGRAEAKSERC